MTLDAAIARPVLLRLASGARAAWAALRQVSSDDAYDRYLQHHAEHHGGAPPLDRKAYYLALQQRKWSGVQRCC